MSGRVYMNFVSGAPVGSTSTTISKGFLVNTVAAGNSAQAILRTLKFFKKLGLGTVTALDSGGFQIFQAETGAIDFTIIYDPSKPMVFGRYLNITPRHCLHTALGTHPNIMFSLDYPVPKEHNKGRQNILFMRNNTFNVRCAREIAAMRDKLCPEIKFFIPLQLYDLDQFDYFMAGLGNINFDGLSLPIRIFSLEKITIFLMKFLKMGIKQAHILGTTRFDVLALLSYFARNYYDFLSVDSTSWRKFATVQVYLRPFSLTSLNCMMNLILMFLMSIIASVLGVAASLFLTLSTCLIQIRPCFSVLIIYGSRSRQCERSMTMLKRRDHCGISL